MITLIEVTMMDADFTPGQAVIDTYVTGGMTMLLARYGTATTG